MPPPPRASGAVPPALARETPLVTVTPGAMVIGSDPAAGLVIAKVLGPFQELLPLTVMAAPAF